MKMSNDICSHLHSLVGNVRNLNSDTVFLYYRKVGLRHGSRKEMAESLQKFKSSVRTIKFFGKNNDEVCLNIRRKFSQKEMSTMTICKEIDFFVFVLGNFVFGTSDRFLSVENNAKKLSVLCLLLIFQMIQPPIRSLQSLSFQVAKQKGLPDSIKNNRRFQVTNDTSIVKNCQLVIPVRKLLCMKEIRDMACFDCLHALHNICEISHSSYTHKLEHCILLHTDTLNEEIERRLQTCFQMLCKEFKHIKEAAFMFPLIGIKFKSYRGSSWNSNNTGNCLLIHDLNCLQHLHIGNRYSDKHNFQQWHQKYGQLDACLSFLQHVFQIKVLIYLIVLFSILKGGLFYSCLFIKSFNLNKTV